MTIDRLSEKTILVTLTPDDMRLYRLDFDEADPDAVRKGLTLLMVKVGEECGLDCRGRSCLIEALPGREGCLLIISVRKAQTRRRYRVKREKTVDCCRFASADDLLDWLSRPESACMSYTLYESGGGYILLPEYPLTASRSGLLSEYACVTRESPVAAARIREICRPVREQSLRRRHFARNSSSAAE